MSAINAYDLIEFANPNTNQEMLTMWDLVRVGYELHRLENLPEEASLASSEDGLIPGVLAIVQSLPDVLHRLECGDSVDEVGGKLRQIEQQLYKSIREDGIPCLGGNKILLGEFLRKLTASLRREMGQLKVQLSVEDSSFRDFLRLVQREYYPTLSKEAEIFLGYAYEAWSLGLQSGAIVLTLLATEHVFRYFYSCLGCSEPLEGKTWGRNRRNLEKEHPEVPEVLWRKIRTLIRYRNSVMHGDSIDMDKASSKWEECRDTAKSMLDYLASVGKSYAPADYEDQKQLTDDLLEFADHSMHYTHHKRGEIVFSLPKRMGICLWPQVPGIEFWHLGQQEFYQSLRGLTPLQLHVRLEWCIRYERLFEVNDDGETTPIIDLSKKGESRLRQLWVNRFLEFLRGWTHYTILEPTSENWRKYHFLHFDIKEQVLKKIGEAKEHQLTSALELWKKLEDQEPRRKGWQGIIDNIDNTLESLQQHTCSS